MLVRNSCCIFGQQLAHRIALVTHFHIRFDPAAERPGSLLDVSGAIFVNALPRQNHETICQRTQESDEDQAGRNDDIVRKPVTNGSGNGDERNQQRRYRQHRRTAGENKLLQSQPELIKIQI